MLRYKLGQRGAVRRGSTETTAASPAPTDHTHAGVQVAEPRNQQRSGLTNITNTTDGPSVNTNITGLVSTAPKASGNTKVKPAEVLAASLKYISKFMPPGSDGMGPIRKQKDTSPSTCLGKAAPELDTKPRTGLTIDDKHNGTLCKVAEIVATGATAPPAAAVVAPTAAAAAAAAKAAAAAAKAAAGTGRRGKRQSRDEDDQLPSPEELGLVPPQAPPSPSDGKRKSKRAKGRR
ncbi:hypothetical protein HXX76_016293 [Chlamydomonas incerta]|uniref:Uncharacterized protein n=1 Tax=Chlamydomonas incerta TaxID=51695 RepID=A0A835VNP1_CHLIN|nr:hypothetical protein HXX76_016293 [Chlamydomonas incerta]|eukprot:KAG2422080.1 hypothetical protein HXX76_016293 [Chlamydomonas incerta]